MPYKKQTFKINFIVLVVVNVFNPSSWNAETKQASLCEFKAILV